MRVCPAIKWGSIYPGRQSFFNRGLTGVIQLGYTYAIPKGKGETTMTIEPRKELEALKTALATKMPSVHTWIKSENRDAAIEMLESYRDDIDAFIDVVKDNGVVLADEIKSEDYEQAVTDAHKEMVNGIKDIEALSEYLLCYPLVLNGVVTSDQVVEFVQSTWPPQPNPILDFLRDMLKESGACEDNDNER